MALRLAVVSDHECLENLPESAVVTGQQTFVIGRSGGCDWVLPDTSRQISSRHCEILTVDGEFFLRDLSTNGTFIDGAEQRISGDIRLTDGSSFTVGACTISVAMVGARPGPPTPAAAPEAVGTAAKGPAWRSNADPAAGLEDPGGFADDVGLTRINPAAPRRPPGPPTTPSLARPVASAPAEAPVEGPGPGAGSARPAEPEDVLSRAAAGLGLAPEALGGLDAGDLVETLGRLVRHSAEDLRTRLDERLVLGRRLHRRVRHARHGPDLNPLATRPVEEALAVMLTADPTGPQTATAVFAGSFADLGAFRNSLDAAQAAALKKIAGEIAPATLEDYCSQTFGGSAGRDLAWEVYGQVWTDLDEDWQRGFVEAFNAYLGEALANDG
jgi:type VI secretion system protein ImpI